MDILVRDDGRSIRAQQLLEAAVYRGFVSARHVQVLTGEVALSWIFKLRRKTTSSWCTATAAAAPAFPTASSQVSVVVKSVRGVSLGHCGHAARGYGPAYCCSYGSGRVPVGVTVGTIAS